MMIHRRCDVQSNVEVFGSNGWEVDASAVALLPQSLQSAWSCLKVHVSWKDIRARGHVVLVMFAQVKGDGACFVRALSVHLFGNEELHVQIRLFIVATSFLSRVAYFSGSGNVQVHSLARFICCLRTSICSSLSHIPFS